MSANILSANVFVCPTTKKLIIAVKNLHNRTGSTRTVLMTYCVLLVPAYIVLITLVSSRAGGNHYANGCRWRYEYKNLKPVNGCT